MAFAALAGLSLLAAAVLSGALGSGDRLRANFVTEKAEESSWRVRAAWACLAVAVLSGALSWLFSHWR